MLLLVWRPYILTKQVSNNAVVGRRAGRGSITASSVSRNAFLGSESGYAVLTGANDNTFLGYQAGVSVTTGARNILIGSGVDTTAVTASDELNIGNLIYGDLAGKMVGIGIIAPTTNALDVSGSIKVAETTTEVCTVVADAGQIRYNKTTKKFQICREW